MLAAGVFATRVAKQFELSSDSVWRHWKLHVSQEKKNSLIATGLTDVKVDVNKLRKTEAESVLQNMLATRAQQQRIADKCEGIGLYQEAIRATVAVQKNLETTAKIVGELKNGNTVVHNNILLSPNWLVMRRAIAEALRPHPEVQREVLGAIRAVETGAGVNISNARAVELKAIDNSEAQQ